MVSRPVWEINPGDFHADTQDMTTAEVGAYMLLLMTYWRVGSLPDSDLQLQRIVRANNFHWRRIKKRLQPLFYDGWKHKRMEADLAKLAAYRERQSANALWKTGTPWFNHGGSTSNAGNPLKSHNQTPATAPHSFKKTKDNSFFGTGHASDFVAGVDSSVSADQPPPANRYQQAWMAALASQLEPHDYAEAIGFLLADKELRDRITSSEIRERGSGVMAAAIAWHRWKKQQP